MEDKKSRQIMEDHEGLILLVDDNPINLTLLTEILQESRYKIKVSINGKVALKAVRTTPPDLILLDIVMPEMDGFEVCRKLKSNPDTADIPVLFMSGLSETQDMLNAFAAGGVDYVTKPFQVAEVLARVNAHMALSKTIRQLKSLEEDHTAKLLKIDESWKLPKSEHRILLVDDNSYNLKLLAKILRGNRYTTKASTSGKFALQAVRTTPPDLILLDIMMPEMDGYEVCRQLKLNPDTADIPVIFISALSETQDKLKAFATGGVDYVSKPFCEDEVLARVNTHLTLRENSQELKNLVEYRTAQLAVKTEKLKEETSERKQVSRKLQRSEQNYCEIFNATDEAIFIHDSSTGNILDFNQSTLEMFGYCQEETLNLSIEELSDGAPPYSQAEARAYMQKAAQEGPQKFEWLCRRKNGELFWVEINLKSSEIGGKSRVIAVVRDITERKKAESKQKKLESQLRQAQKMEAIGTLAGGVAHDFNNILAGIFGYTQLAQLNIEKTDSVKKYLEQIYEGAERARDLVQQILTFSRQAEAEMLPIYPHLVIKEAIKLLRASIPSMIEIREELPKTNMILADPTHIHQIMMNLCTNSSHAMADQTGILTISLKDIEIEENEIMLKSLSVDVGSYLVLTVSDTGFGMNKATVDKIFDPYFTTKAKEEGTGLGLSVVHGIVENCGGFISVYSEPGQGTTFKIYFPSISPKEIKSSERPVAPMPTGTEHILLVDDENSIVETMEQMLINLGYRVTAHSKSSDAIQDFENRPNEFALVITDMNMPHISGAELVKRLLATNSEISVILCTGFSKSINEKKIIASGFQKILMKPVIMRDLAKTVREVLDSS